MAAATMGSFLGLVVVIAVTEPTSERDLDGTRPEQSCERSASSPSATGMGAAEPWGDLDAREPAPEPQTCSGASPAF